MFRSVILVFLAGLLFLAAPVMGQAADIPRVPYIEADIATAGPVSWFCLPDGTGSPPTEAFNSYGATVDGTLSIVLWYEMPPWGEVVPNFPREDIWLLDDWGTMVSCQNGTIPDANTDAEGRTFWTVPLKVGGHFEPGGGNRLGVYISGWNLYSPVLDELRINSADLNGDLFVNLSDVAQFSQGYFGPYDYSYDFRYDGTINLSDLALMASSVGAVCP